MIRWRHERNTDPRYDVEVLARFKMDGDGWVAFAYVDRGQAIVAPSPELMMASEFFDRFAPVDPAAEVKS